MNHFRLLSPSVVLLLIISGLGTQGCSQTSDRRVENLSAFARLYGYVKYFHPSDESASLEWDRFLVYGVEKVIDATDTDDLSDRLKELFLPIAPTIQITVGDLPTEIHTALSTDSDAGTHTVVWQHLGHWSGRLGRDSLIGGEFPFFDEYPQAGETYEADLGLDLRARIPLALWADSTTTIPRGQLDSLRVRIDRSLDDREAEQITLGLAAVVKFWNKHEHFFPYFDVVDVNWDGELDKALARGLLAANSADNLDNFLLMMTALQDGHANARYSSTSDNSLGLSARFEWVEGHLAVTMTDTLAVAVGDVIETIDGMAINDWYYQVEKRISGTSQWKRVRAARGLFYGSPEVLHVTSAVVDSVSLSLRRADNSLYDVVLRRYQRPWESFYYRPGEPIRILDGDIYYVDLVKAEWDSTADQMNEIASAAGVVFDLRGYPNGWSGVHIQKYLLSEPDSAKYMFWAQVLRPHMKDVTWAAANPLNAQPANPHIQGEVVFLTDARAISAAEGLMGYVHGYKLGTIVGTETGGANGLVTTSKFGEWAVRSTGMKVLRHDGEQLFGLGFPPDVRAEPTLDGLRTGRDDVLEIGLSVLRDKIKAARLE